MNTTVVVKTSAGEVVADLSQVVAVRDFGDESAQWRGPVGLLIPVSIAGLLIPVALGGVVVFCEGNADSGEWPDLSDADLEIVEAAVVDEIGRWGTARTGRVQTHVTIDEYRAGVAARLAA